MNKSIRTTKSKGVRSERVSRLERQWIRRSKAGDQEAFANLYDQHVSPIYGFIFARVEQEMIAEDLTSQVFLKAWENIAQFQELGIPLRAWLFRIARNTLIDHYRTAKSHICLELLPSDKSDPELDVENQLEDDWEEEALAEAMGQLTIEQNHAIRLKFLEGRNNQEIASAMGKEVGAIRALQMRGLQTLAKILNETEQEVSGS